MVLDLDEQYRLEGGEANHAQGVSSLSPSGASGIRRTLSGRSFRPKEPQPNWDDLGEHFDTMSFSPREEEQLFDLPTPEEKALQGVRLSTGKPQQLPPLFTASSLLFQGRYVVTTLGESLALVDIRRAQLRIIYDGYLTGITSHAYSSEQPLFPEVLEFTPSELPTAIEVMAELSKLGFDFGDLGDGHFSVAEAPSLLAREAINFVRLIVADSLDTHRSGEEYVRSFLAEAAAEAEVLQMPLPRTGEEVSDLLSELTSSSDAYFTPSGKSIIALLPESMIGSFFS